MAKARARFVDRFDFVRRSEKENVKFAWKRNREIGRSRVDRWAIGDDDDLAWRRYGAPFGDDVVDCELDCSRYVGSVAHGDWNGET